MREIFILVALVLQLLCLIALARTVSDMAPGRKPAPQLWRANRFNRLRGGVSQYDLPPLTSLPPPPAALDGGSAVAAAVPVAVAAAAILLALARRRGASGSGAGSPRAPPAASSLAAAAATGIGAAALVWAASALLGGPDGVAGASCAAACAVLGLLLGLLANHAATSSVADAAGSQRLDAEERSLKGDL